MRRKVALNDNLSTKNLKEGLVEFEQYCRIKNLSEVSITFYENSYNRFIKFFPETNLIKDINKQVVDNYILFLKQDNINDISINTHLAGIRVIFYYFMRLGYISPSFKISKIKAQKKIMETYTEPEIKLLLKKPDTKTCPYTEYRDWVITNLLLATGMRIRTLINLKPRDIDLYSHMLTYTATKNRRQQIVPLSDTMTMILREYLRLRDMKDDDWLFCSAYGLKLTRNAVEHDIKKYNNRRGVLRTGIHKWRHTFAKMWILGGGDPFRLQRMLGHADLDTVKEYMDFFSQDMKKDFDKINPLEQMQTRKEYIRLNTKKEGRR